MKRDRGAVAAKEKKDGKKGNEMGRASEAKSEWQQLCDKCHAEDFYLYVCVVTANWLFKYNE